QHDLPWHEHMSLAALAKQNLRRRARAVDQDQRCSVFRADGLGRGVAIVLATNELVHARNALGDRLAHFRRFLAGCFSRLVVRPRRSGGGRLPALPADRSSKRSAPATGAVSTTPPAAV